MAFLSDLFDQRLHTDKEERARGRDNGQVSSSLFAGSYHIVALCAVVLGLVDISTSQHLNISLMDILTLVCKHISLRRSTNAMAHLFIPRAWQHFQKDHIAHRPK